jgi:hypothetical protein
MIMAPHKRNPRFLTTPFSKIRSNIDHHRLLQVVYSDARAASGFLEIE